MNVQGIRGLNDFFKTIAQRTITKPLESAGGPLGDSQVGVAAGQIKFTWRAKRCEVYVDVVGGSDAGAELRNNGAEAAIPGIKMGDNGEPTSERGLSRES